MSNSPEHSPLGKNSAYRTDYAPELLFPIPRIGKRDELGLTGTLPFFGVDIWNAYELSWLNMRGKPQVAVARITVPADSPNIIESKSFKLYLNSFNQTRLGGPEALRDLLQQDLSAATGANVHVVLTMQEDFGKLQMGELEGLLLDRLDIEVDNYSPQPSILKANFEELPVEEVLVSHLLKSNCLVTGQPDWGSVQISYSGPQIDQESLLKYLIGFREHNEFHEQCVERIFVDILRECQPAHLTVYARYTRRGGLDINPWRSNFTKGGRPSNLRNARQ
ncbi:NADPH-dependent 7-cyano-7-deazaguanine reductase QueF [Pseudoduganella albidiflava]|uniref:NADPH-dependent 7-cyano-7-deazaguanine reductase n=1 Tax=Pseudoduganella albidiflava TaxID=321983 RepID=A0A411X4H6_9BURK|nr:NADPH-dependent 7-cyano-7-deazaguanine reductase QueF [Pseudoduganella albidiflava]QBI03926.1 NADPH-dependent 7-cyano-7-deazaguanine reductase QueF [Pseudoduganella albidiflava]GGY23334.1 NADPH-dependent 7-cyano-7-deazaguanine reductase [Pseudoduganella albidiflava]